MKNYRNVVAALALTLVLSAGTYADGIIVAEKATPTPTPVPAVNGIIVAEATNSTTVDAAKPAPGAADAVTLIALNLLQNVLTLF